MPANHHAVHTVTTMLGAAGIGKTTFLIGMYAIMREECPQGFTFSTDPDTDIELDQRWNAIVSQKGVDRWPEGNNVDDVVKYTFQFNHGLTRRIINFDWLDYRGGALTDKSTVSDVKILKEQLHKSNCVMLCVSGEDLAIAGNENVVRSKACISRMLLFLTELAAERQRRNEILPMVMIVITKFDHCKNRAPHEIIDQLKRLFEPLFTEEGGWLVAICPVSLGAELATSRDGNVRPENVHVPVSFAAYCRLQEESDKLKEEASVHRERASRAIQSSKEAESTASNLGQNWFSRLWNGVDIAEQKMEAERLRLNAEAALRDSVNTDESRARILASVQLVLAKLIPDCLNVYDNGKEVPRGK